MRHAAVLVCLALAACATKPLFDIATLQPTEEADQVTLTGWLRLGDQIKLYPVQQDLGATGGGVCISGVLLSLAGVPGPEYDNRKMQVSGYLRRLGGEATGSIRDECGSGLVLLVNDVSVP